MDAKLRIAGIIRESIVDGPGIRFTVFCQGCPHNCPGCHNPDTHDFAGGSDCSVDRILREIEKNPLLAGVTFSGGEPMCQPEGFAALAEGVKAMGKTVAVYTGYTLDQLIERAKGLGSGKDLTEAERKATAKIIMLADILIDGRFVQEKRDLTLRFRGSSNQRVIDMNRTRKEGRIILYED